MKYMDKRDLLSHCAKSCLEVLLLGSWKLEDALFSLFVSIKLPSFVPLRALASLKFRRCDIGRWNFRDWEVKVLKF